MNESNKSFSKQITLKPPVNAMLDSIAKHRVATGNPIHARQNIIAELIGTAYKKEIK